MPYTPEKWSEQVLDHEEKDPAKLEDDADAVSQVLNRLTAAAQQDLSNNQSPVSAYNPDKYRSIAELGDEDDLDNSVQPKKPRSQGP